MLEVESTAYGEDLLQLDLLTISVESDNMLIAIADVDIDTILMCVNSITEVC